MVVAPHIDDEALGCGGVLQRFAPEDALVAFVSERMQDKRFAGDGYIAYTGDTRAGEMEQVSEVLGYTPARLGFPLHRLDTVPLEDIIDRLGSLVCDFAPGAMFVPADSHDIDHSVVWDAVCSVMRPHFWNGTVLRYYVWGVPSPTTPAVYIPLSEDEHKRKLRAVSAYRTQVAPGGKLDPLYPYSSESMCAYAVAAGRMVHFPYAEVFEPVRIVGNETTARVLWRKDDVTSDWRD